VEALFLDLSLTFVLHVSFGEFFYLHRCGCQHDDSPQDLLEIEHVCINNAMFWQNYLYDPSSGLRRLVHTSHNH